MTRTEVFFTLFIGSSPNYEPNSFNKGGNTFTFNSEARYEPYKVTGLVARHKPNHPNCDFSQPGTLYRKVFDNVMRDHTVRNIVAHMGKSLPREIVERAVKNFYKADPEYGDGIAKHMGFPSVKSRL